MRFCKISDEERKKHGRTPKAIEEILRRCMEENVLSPFLATRQKEVAEIMVTLFDQEKVMEIHDYHIAEAARRDGILKGRAEGHAKGRAEGRAEGHAEGRVEGTLSSIINLMETLGLSSEAAMKALKVPENERPKYTKMLKQ